jgi:hypothetical protein
MAEHMKQRQMPAQNLQTLNQLHDDAIHDHLVPHATEDHHAQRVKTFQKRKTMARVYKDKFPLQSEDSTPLVELSHLLFDQADSVAKRAEKLQGRVECSSDEPAETRVEDGHEARKSRPVKGGRPEQGWGEGAAGRGS